jgi:hypothetical protein
MQYNLYFSSNWTTISNQPTYENNRGKKDYCSDEEFEKLLIEELQLWLLLSLGQTMVKLK